MAVPQQLARPIQALREHIKALEAAITLTLADPRPKPVHRLRTSTRRIEALLILLDLLPNLPDHARPARKSRKLLNKLRRAAGAVRDLDVQQDLVRSLANTEDPAFATREAPPPTAAPPSHPETRRPGTRHRLEKHASRLAKALEHHRNRQASALVDTLTKLQPRLSPTLEHLLDTLAPASSLTISPAELTSLTYDWYRDHTPAPARALTTDDPDLLHTIRKSAKLARYIAEVATADPTSASTVPANSQSPSSTPLPSSTSAGGAQAGSQTSTEFESLQQTGGSWHDLLTLTDIARHHLGKRSPLTRHLKSARKEALRQYQQQLGNTSI